MSSPLCLASFVRSSLKLDRHRPPTVTASSSCTAGPMDGPLTLLSSSPVHRAVCSGVGRRSGVLVSKLPLPTSLTRRLRRLRRTGDWRCQEARSSGGAERQTKKRTRREAKFAPHPLHDGHAPTCSRRQPGHRPGTGQMAGQQRKRKAKQRSTETREGRNGPANQPASEPA